MLILLFLRFLEASHFLAKGIEMTSFFFFFSAKRTFFARKIEKDSLDENIEKNKQTRTDFRKASIERKERREEERIYFSRGNTKNISLKKQSSS